MPGAFAASLKRLAGRGDKVRMLWQHDPAKPIGVWDEIREDAKGLWVRGRLLPEVAQAREAVALIEAGAIEGLSIGYRTLRATRDEKGRRMLAEVELWEVSLVTFPANDPARVSDVRATALPSEREFERWLRREAGLTEAQAKTVIAKGYRQVRREAMPSDEACGELLESVRRFAAIPTGAGA